MKPDVLFEFPRNQTQSNVDTAAHLVSHEFIKDGPRTFVRLKWLAAQMAERKKLPSIMVYSTALHLLRDRVPDALPPEMRAPQHSGDKHG